MNSQTKHQFFNRSNLFKKHGPAKHIQLHKVKSFDFIVVSVERNWKEPFDSK